MKTNEGELQFKLGQQAVLSTIPMFFIVSALAQTAAMFWWPMPPTFGKWIIAAALLGGVLLTAWLQVEVPTRFYPVKKTAKILLITYGLWYAIAARNVWLGTSAISEKAVALIVGGVSLGTVVLLCWRHFRSAPAKFHQ